MFGVYRRVVVNADIYLRESMLWALHMLQGGREPKESSENVFFFFLNATM